MRWNWVPLVGCLAGCGPGACDQVLPGRFVTGTPAMAVIEVSRGPAASAEAVLLAQEWCRRTDRDAAFSGAVPSTTQNRVHLAFDCRPR
jgi:hypothetical protein